MTPTTNEATVRFYENTAVTLTVTHLRGSLTGKQQIVYRLPAIIGRSRNCDVRLAPNDVEASGHHARLFFDGEAIWLEDLGSTNGTYLNGTHITRAKLASGDEIELGYGGPQLRITFAWPMAQWPGKAQCETTSLGTYEFPLRSPWRFPVYGLGLLLLLLLPWFGSLAAAMLLIPPGVFALLLGWGMARINLTLTPYYIEYQGLLQQVTLPWTEVMHLQVKQHTRRPATYIIIGQTQRIHFRPPDNASGLELGQLIVRRTGKQWEIAPADKN